MNAGPSLEDLERLVDYRLRRFRSHEEFQDIRQEGLIAAWQAWQRRPDLPFSMVVCRQAYWGALEYLRSTRCRQPRRERREIAAPEFLPLADLERFAPAGAEEEGFRRIEDQALFRRAWSLLRDRERAAVRLVFGAGLSYAAAARRMGCDHRNVHRLIEQGLDRCRRELGLAESHAGENSSQRRQRKNSVGGRQ